MASQFSERLDFLMSLTNTPNSALARELAFNASYISRIRNGKRGMPLHQPFIEPTAAYLASRIREPYQIQAVEQVLRPHESWPTGSERATELVARWLLDNTATFDTRFEKLFASLANVRKQTDASVENAIESFTSPSDEGTPGTMHSFFGNDGKRVATERFLASLIETGTPQTLLVYSDENMDWLVEDPDFSRRWLALLMQFIANGSSITIIHTVTRDIGEMLDAIQRWLPLYLVGHIESYYCPRIRDRICRRTLIVAPDMLALTSNSIESHADGMACLLTGEPHVVNAYEREFRNLLSLCRPLAKVVSLSEHAQTKAILDTFDPNREHITIAPGGGVEPLPASMSESFALIESTADVRETDQLPPRVIAIIGEDSGFALISLDDPPVIMHVTERLITAAFTEYLLS